MESGDVIGGFTCAQWTSDRGWTPDKFACVFSVNTQRAFPVIDHRHAINAYDTYGPRFRLNLSAYSEPFNDNNNCCSYVNCKEYMIPYDENGNNSLTR